MLEEYDYPEPSRKRVYVLVFFLVLLGGLAVVVAFRTTTGFKGVFASRDTRADANQPPAEPNQPAAEANEPSAQSNRLPTGPNEPSEQKPAEPNDPNDKKPPRPAHKHPAFTERVAERARMASWQIEARGVTDPNTLTAMRVVPRHAFARQTEERYAYADQPLPIGYDQTISQPMGSG